MGGRSCRGWTGRPAAADNVAAPAQHRVRSDQQPQALAPRPGYHAEQDREQGPVRPLHVRAAPAAAGAGRRADGAGSRSPRSAKPPHAATAATIDHRVIRRKTNRRHMISDHHGRTAGSATLLVRAADGILRHAQGERAGVGPQTSCAPPWSLLLVIPASTAVRRVFAISGIDLCIRTFADLNEALDQAHASRASAEDR